MRGERNRPKKEGRKGKTNERGGRGEEINGRVLRKKGRRKGDIERKRNKKEWGRKNQIKRQRKSKRRKDRECWDNTLECLQIFTY
jgi:hypothetical protein